MCNNQEFDESRELALRLCRTHVGGPWTNIEDSQVTIKVFGNGMANRNILCEINGHQATDQDSSSHPRAVVVHLYHGGAVKDTDVKFVGELAEAVIIERLSKIGMAPKLYGVFKGGRIEEYIPSENGQFKDVSDPEILKAIARKVAKVHAQTMPIPKQPLRVQHMLKLAAMHPKPETTSMSKLMAEAADRVFDFPIEDELRWIESNAPKFSGGRLVFSHNDLTLNNILLRKDIVDIDEKLLLIDFESSGYYYRGYDLAYFLELRKFEFGMIDGKVYERSYECENEEEMQKLFLEEYLTEFQHLTSTQIPKYDTFEHLQMETQFFALLGNLLFVCYNRNMLRSPLPGMCDDEEWFTSRMVGDVDTYLKNKAHFRESYPEMF